MRQRRLVKGGIPHTLYTTTLRAAKQMYRKNKTPATIPIATAAPLLPLCGIYLTFAYVRKTYSRLLYHTERP